MSNLDKSIKDVSEVFVNWKDAAKEAFGETPGTALNLRGLRNREGLTQAELGQAIGIEQSNISKKWNKENGRSDQKLPSA